ncbi:hypothetical protein [Modestobacter lapidis]|nr:hypothetical protein [Modestobacter lapidis]
MEATTLLPSPRITAAILEAATYARTAVVVQDAHGAVYTLDRLNEAQAADPDLTVLLDHYAAMDYVACSGGRIAAAARAATVTLAQQHARGLL